MDLLTNKDYRWDPNTQHIGYLNGPNLFGWQIFWFLTNILKPDKKSVSIQMEMAKMVAILFLLFECRIAKTFRTYLNVFSPQPSLDISP